MRKPGNRVAGARRARRGQLGDAAGNRPRRWWRVAQVLTHSTLEQDDGIGVAMLRSIRDVFDRLAIDKISSADLCTELARDEEARWATWNPGKSITPNQVARILSGFGIRSKGVRTGPQSTPKGYERQQFTECWSRYLDGGGEQSEQGESVERNASNTPPTPGNPDSSRNAATSPPDKAESVAADIFEERSRNGETQAQQGCCGVAAQNPESGAQPCTASETDDFFASLNARPTRRRRAQ
ncbi:hypothetical protein BTH42_18610 [Burkholderia sp. SRS-W-2-2016]|nr:hypothetical protein BTH42_18610 [Burkholderia sp. SRS-W-2-2016]